jgi:hypothetical protein
MSSSASVFAGLLGQDFLFFFLASFFGCLLRFLFDFFFFFLGFLFGGLLGVFYCVCANLFVVVYD